MANALIQGEFLADDWVDLAELAHQAMLTWAQTPDDPELTWGSSSQAVADHYREMRDYILERVADAEGRR